MTEKIQGSIYGSHIHVYGARFFLLHSIWESKVWCNWLYEELWDAFGFDFALYKWSWFDWLIDVIFALNIRCDSAHAQAGITQPPTLALRYAQVWLIPAFSSCEGSKVTQSLPQMLFSCSARKLHIFGNTENPTYCRVHVAHPAAQVQHVQAAIKCAACGCIFKLQICNIFLLCPSQAAHWPASCV